MVCSCILCYSLDLQEQSERSSVPATSTSVIQAAHAGIWFNDRKIVDTVNITPQG